MARMTSAPATKTDPGNYFEDFAIGQEIVDILRAADLPAEWTGSPDARIESQPLLYEFPIDD